MVELDSEGSANRLVSGSSEKFVLDLSVETVLLLMLGIVWDGETEEGNSDVFIEVDKLVVNDVCKNVETIVDPLTV